MPTSSGISQARKRVGAAVLAEVFAGVAQAVATRSTRGAWLRGWRLLAIDGFDVDLPDTPDNAAEFGYAGSGENRSAFPKARVVALAECGTHVFVAAEVDAYSSVRFPTPLADCRSPSPSRPVEGLPKAVQGQKDGVD